MRIYNKIEQKNFETNSIFTGSAPSISTSAPNTAALTKSISDLTADKLALQVQLANAIITTTPFIKQENIKLSSGNVLSADGTQLSYGQGEGLLVIDPVDNLIIITIYSNSAKARNSTAATPINLVNGFTGVIFKLTFGNTNDFIFSNIFIANMSNLANGQLLFKIPSIQAKLILENSEHNFMVTKVDPNLTETLMYTGTWLSSVDYQAATSAAAAATTAAINAASLAAANAQITANNILISQLTAQKVAAETSLSTHMQTHNTANVGGAETGGLTILPPTTTTTTVPPPPVPAIIRYVNATTNIAAVANITYAKTGELIGLFTNVNSTTLTEIKLGNTLVPANSYPPTNGSGFMTFTVPAGIGDIIPFPTGVGISIRTIGGSAGAATGPDYLVITE
jgi:hypothetical protein